MTFGTSGNRLTQEKLNTAYRHERKQKGVCSLLHALTRSKPPNGESVRKFCQLELKMERYLVGFKCYISFAKS